MNTRLTGKPVTGRTAFRTLAFGLLAWTLPMVTPPAYGANLSGNARSAPAREPSAREPAVHEIQVKEVLTGFRVKDAAGRIYRLAGVRAFESDSTTERAQYETALRNLLTDWINLGETVYVMHNGRRERDGTIPAYLLIGEGVNVSVEYLAGGFALLDISVPAWIDVDLLRADADELQLALERSEFANADSPDNPAERARAEHARVEVSPLTIFIVDGDEIIYRGALYPELVVE